MKSFLLERAKLEVTKVDLGPLGLKDEFADRLARYDAFVRQMSVAKSRLQRTAQIARAPERPSQPKESLR